MEYNSLVMVCKMEIDFLQCIKRNEIINLRIFEVKENV